MPLPPDFETTLWAAADQLWTNSALQPSEYSTPVLALIFLRYADARFAHAEKELASKARRRGAIGKDDYLALGVLYLPEAARFQRLLELPDGADIGKKLNDAMKAIEAENDELKDALPKTYGRFDAQTLKELLKLFGTIPQDVEGDVFGRIYEYFLGNFAPATLQKGGEFYTPVSVVRLIVEILEPYHGRILDPACGSGGMFVQSANLIAAHEKRASDEISIYGIEKIAQTLRLARMNLAVHGLSGDIKEANTYYDADAHGAEWGKFDFVAATCPRRSRGSRHRLAQDPAHAGRGEGGSMLTTDRSSETLASSGRLFGTALGMHASFVLAVALLAVVAACSGATTGPSPSTPDDGGTGSSSGDSSSSGGRRLADSGDERDASTGGGALGTEGGTCSGTGCPVVLASGQNGAQAIAVDATSVYWTNFGVGAGMGTVMKMPIGGGTPTTLASAQYELQGGIAVDATNVYWTTWGNRPVTGTPDTGTVVKVPIGGGTLTTLASGQLQPTGITVDATSVYWTNLTGGTVMKMPIGGGTLTTLTSQGTGDGVQVIAVDATSVYWTNPSEQMVTKMPIGGGTPTTLASGQVFPDGIAIDATSVYWVNSAGNPGTGNVMKVPIDGGTPTTLASGQNFPLGIIVDATSVYWTNRGANVASGSTITTTGNNVMKVPIDGGTLTTLASASGQSEPWGIAVDATSVYWTEGGNVMKVAK